MSKSSYPTSCVACSRDCTKIGFVHLSSGLLREGLWMMIEEL